MDGDRFDAFSRRLVQTGSRRRVVAAFGSGLLATVLGPSLRHAVAQGNNANAQGCQQGGYATRVRGEGPRRGEGFQTVGECVSYAARGGTLVPRGLGDSDPCDIARSYDPATHLPSLASLNLGPCDLSGLDLSGADLSTASLIGGDLPGADLTGANLNGANLYNADLNSATLVRATLVGANLDGAELAWADLSGATLRAATLNGAIWGSTTCPDGTNSDDNGGTCLGHL